MELGFIGTSRSCKKFGKYGVGFTNGSISQAKRFTVWSWQNSSPDKAHRNGIDIEDVDWINAGAKIAPSPAEGMPEDWFNLSGHEKILIWNICSLGEM